MMEVNDPLASTNPPAIDLFPVLYLIDACIKYIPKWDHEDIVIEERVTDMMTFVITLAYSYFYRDKLFYFNKVTSQIVMIGLGWIMFHSFKKFLDTFYANDPLFVKVETLSQIFDYSLGLRIIYNIIYDKTANFDVDLESGEQDMNTIKKILETMDFLRNCQSRNSNVSIANIKITDKYLKIKGMYLEHQESCGNTFCPCNPEKNSSYGNDDLRRFRDLFVIKLKYFVDCN